MGSILPRCRSRRSRRALIGARFGSGRSRPSSKRIMKWTHRRRSAAIAFTTFWRTFPSRPYSRKIVSTSWVSFFVQVIDLVVLTAFLGPRNARRSARREVAAKTHSDSAGYDFGEPGRYDHFGADCCRRKACRQCKRYGQPSAMPITTSRTDSDAVKCFSMCGVAGMMISIGRSARSYAVPKAQDRVTGSIRNSVRSRKM